MDNLEALELIQQEIIRRMTVARDALNDVLFEHENEAITLSEETLESVHSAINLLRD